MSEEKLSRALQRQVKKAATGPLLGPVVPAPSGPPPADQPATTRAPLGSIQAVRARIGDVPGEG
ncbi:MAG: hypothetical protein VKQ33_10690 [Candidatus Sericytochromatia bacterium]|nr:hypothetical protein [Candidatus Sericytochromatia bacterium]